MGDHSDVPPWTRRILPLNFYTKFFRADVFYRIMTEREREKGSDGGGKKTERERGWKKRERERKRVERRHGRQDGYISLVEIRARARMRETERERGEDGNSPDIGKAGPE